MEAWSTPKPVDCSEHRVFHLFLARYCGMLFVGAGLRGSNAFATEHDFYCHRRAPFEFQKLGVWVPRRAFTLMVARPGQNVKAG